MFKGLLSSSLLGIVFDSPKSSYGTEKVNYPENTILYLNQAYSFVKKTKNLLL